MNDLYSDWAQVYDYFYPDRSGELSFWAQVAEPYGHRLLDLMCGTAELSLGLARCSFQVLGVDLSPAMLTQGSTRLASAADHPARNLSLSQGSALAIPMHDGMCDFALVAGSGSFNHLNESQAEIALQELHRVLRPEGGLGMELINPHLLQEIYPERTFGPFRPTPPGVWLEKKSANVYEQDARRFHIHQVTQYEIDGQTGGFVVSFDLHVHQPEGFRALLESSGWTNVQFYGGYDLEPFDRWSPDLLVVARRSSTGAHR